MRNVENVAELNVREDVDRVVEMTLRLSLLWRPAVPLFFLFQHIVCLLLFILSMGCCVWSLV